MKRLFLLTVVAMLAAVPARADLKLTQNVSGKGMMGLGGNSVSTTYIKGLKMRTETVNGDTTRTMIFDLDGQKLYSFDSKKKEADVWDMADFGKQMTVAVDPSQITASVKPTGQTKQLLGRTVTGYEMNISMPTRMGDPKNGMAMTVNLTGPVWVAKGAPGTPDYLRFYQAAAERGWFFGDPRAAKGNAGQMKAMTEMYRQLAATGGVPYETDMNITMGGDGPMAAMMARMGGMAMLSTVQSADVASLPDDLFAPPAGYKLTPRK